MNLVLSLSLNLGIILVKFPLYCFFEENLSSMPLGIPQKKKKGVCVELCWVELGSLMVIVALLTVSILLLEHLGKITAFATLELKITISLKSGK